MISFEKDLVGQNVEALNEMECVQTRALGFMITKDAKKPPNSSNNSIWMILALDGMTGVCYKLSIFHIS